MAQIEVLVRPLYENFEYISHVLCCYKYTNKNVACIWYLSCYFDSGYLFEGHLTVDPEPEQPGWLVQSNLLTAAATLFAGESSEGHLASADASEGARNVLEELVARLDNIIPEVSLVLL